jgi:hypothetical protein
MRAEVLFPGPARVVSAGQRVSCFCVDQNRSELKPTRFTQVLMKSSLSATRSICLVMQTYRSAIFLRLPTFSAARKNVTNQVGCFGLI